MKITIEQHNVFQGTYEIIHLMLADYWTGGLNKACWDSQTPRERLEYLIEECAGNRNGKA